MRLSKNISKKLFNGFLMTLSSINKKLELAFIPQKG